jgi:CDP-alcohol phosphatidyltransferase
MITVKRSDAWWTVLVVDPIAAPLVRLLARVRPVTPNRVTIASVAVSMLSAAAWVRGHSVAAALLFQGAFLLDCIDGKLAHLRGDVSRYGAWMDSVADAVRMTACYGGLAWWLAGRPDFNRPAALVLAAYPVLHAGVILTGHAWPRETPEESTTISLAPSTTAMLRAAPGRLGMPGSTVDAEAVVFTLGPLLAAPLIGLWVAAGMNLAHLAVAIAARGRVAMRGDRPPRDM